MPASASRGYAAARYLLELDGGTVGSVNSATGGYGTSDVVEEKAGADLIMHKHLAGVKYEDITIECGSGMSKSFYTWLSDTLDLKVARKDGAIVAVDYNLTEASRLNFFHSLVTEIAFPALDASSKDAAKFTVKLSPEYTRSAKSSGKAQGGVDSKLQQKKWLPSNFRLRIDGVDCTRVNKIASLVVKQKLSENPVGELRDYQKEPALLEIPDLVVTFPESHADDFVSWHNDFVLQGNNGQDREKSGTLEYLAPDLKTVLFTITFFNLGIFKLAPEPVAPGSENIRRLTASMYCERMTFKPSTEGAAAAVASPASSAGATNGDQAGAVTAPAATPVFVDQEPPLVVVSGANGPLVTEDIPASFTRIRRT
jgi:phage tail-like protein